MTKRSIPQYLYLFLLIILFLSGTVFYLIEKDGIRSIVFTIPLLSEHLVFLQVLHRFVGIVIMIGLTFHFILSFRTKSKVAMARKTIYGLIYLDIIFLFISGFEKVTTGLSHYLFDRSIHTVGVIILLIFLAVSFLLSILESNIKIKDILCAEINHRSSLTVLILVFLLAIPMTWYIQSRSGLHLVSYKSSGKVKIDGFKGMHEWDTIKGVSFWMYGGANNAQKTKVSIKSQHNRQYIYFYIEWDDPDRSYNRFVEKDEGYWKIRKTEPTPQFGENKYYEDQLSVFISKDNRTCLTSCHYNTDVHKITHFDDSGLHDVWYWKAVSTDPIMQADDGWIGERNDSTLCGFIYDNLGAGGTYTNLNQDWKQPYFFPLFDSQRYWLNLTYYNVVPYFAEIDSLPVGYLVPEIIISPMTGDRADVRAKGNWSLGKWEVEIGRLINTGSPYDLPLTKDVTLSLALFNNAQYEHTLFFQSIYLTVEK